MRMILIRIHYRNENENHSQFWRGRASEKSSVNSFVPQASVRMSASTT